VQARRWRSASATFVAHGVGVSSSAGGARTLARMPARGSYPTVSRGNERLLRLATVVEEMELARDPKAASELTDNEIRTLIANHERTKATTVPRYRELIDEHARRFGKGLRVEVSLVYLKEAAKRGEFTTYGSLAEANGVHWSKVRRRMDGAHGHLGDVLSVCHAHGLPLLTALCVNKEAIKDGTLSDEALSGFIKAAKRLGYTMTDDRAFLKHCQKQCFAWGQRAASEGA
jgi:hypothetical protein